MLIVDGLLVGGCLLHRHFVYTLVLLFAGGPSQQAHLAPTYAAVNALCILGTEEAYKVIDRYNTRKHGLCFPCYSIWNAAQWACGKFETAQTVCSAGKSCTNSSRVFGHQKERLRCTMEEKWILGIKMGRGANKSTQTRNSVTWWFKASGERLIWLPYSPGEPTVRLVWHDWQILPWKNSLMALLNGLSCEQCSMKLLLIHQ